LNEEGNYMLKQEPSKVCEAFNSIWESLDDPNSLTQTKLLELNDIVEKVVHATIIGAESRFCLTEKKLFGRIPAVSEPGDLICIFAGANVPFVIRPSSDIHLPSEEGSEKR
jgi:hypothetical protein